MKIALIGTYPPRQCGIGTFSNNLFQSLLKNFEVNTEDSAHVIAMNDGAESYKYPKEVTHTIQADHQGDYIRAAKFINYSSDICMIEHEFGIFGGDDGVYILSLIYRLEIPLMVTFHTVLENPTYTQRAIIEEIGRVAQRITVMSKRAIGFLENIYGIPKEKIVYIEHGVPDLKDRSQLELKRVFNFQDKRVISTFGLLSRNKGVETVINALANVVDKHPDVLYLILGKTHPTIVKNFGEEYRNYLKRLVRQHGLENNVYFYDEFLTEERIFEYLSLSDIYVTPYLTEAQITSGTLSYAVGAGTAVVSTPYWHAQELLDNDRGVLFDFKDEEKLSEILNGLLDDSDRLETIRRNAYDYGKKLRWPKIARQYLHVMEYLVTNWEPKASIQAPIDISIMPTYNLGHVLRLTDDTGIVQHAKYGVPNLKEGYCVDDNGRALLCAILAHRYKKDPDSLKVMPIYLSYMHYMQNEDGTFRNFLSFSRQFLDEVGSEDSFGRAIWSLGYLIKYPPNDAYGQLAWDIFIKSFDQFDKLEHIRSIANTMIGIAYYLKVNSGDGGMVKVLKSLGNKLIKAYEDNSDDHWKWFEQKMTYDNGILPLALYHAVEVTGDERFLEVAEESTAFLTSVTLKQDFFIPVGNEGWYERGKDFAEYDQQSVDTMAMVLLYNQAYQVTKNKDYLDRLFKVYLWFLGDNSLRLPLYDHETGGCCDGLESTGLNRNQGAESTLAYWISHLVILGAFEKEHEYIDK